VGEMADSKAEFKDLKVLVVDDRMIIRKLVSAQLEGLGIKEIQTADDGDEVLDKMKSEDFDVVFLDWAMPKKSGLNVLDECRQKSEYDKIAIIMLTAASEQKSVKLAMEAGATSYIIKPVSIATLETKLKHAIEWIEEQNKEENIRSNS
jgi:two-component system chemotaxis response regulator CheY